MIPNMLYDFNEMVNWEFLFCIGFDTWVNHENFSFLVDHFILINCMDSYSIIDQFSWLINVPSTLPLVDHQLSSQSYYPQSILASFHYFVVHNCCSSTFHNYMFILYKQWPYVFLLLKWIKFPLLYFILNWLNKSTQYDMGSDIIQPKTFNHAFKSAWHVNCYNKSI